MQSDNGSVKLYRDDDGVQHLPPAELCQRRTYRGQRNTGSQGHLKTRQECERILRGAVNPTDRELRKNYLRARLDNLDTADGKMSKDEDHRPLAHLVELVVDNIPLCINDFLILLRSGDTDFRVLVLRLELKTRQDTYREAYSAKAGNAYLQLNVEQADLRILKPLRLLLKPGVREGLLEGNTLHQHRVLKGSPKSNGAKSIKGSDNKHTPREPPGTFLTPIISRL